MSRAASASEKRVVSIFTGNSNSGSACIQELFEKYADCGLSVRGVFRSADKAKEYADKYPSLHIVTGCDASKPDTLASAFAGAHAALIVTPHDPTRDFGDDAQLTANMIDSAVTNGVRYIVLVASFTVIDVDKMPIIGMRFKPSELLLEKYAASSSSDTPIQYTVLRGGFFMENALFMFKDSVKNAASSSVNFAADAYVPAVATRDIGRSAAACLAARDPAEHHAKYYSMNGPQMLSGQDMADVFAKVLDRPVAYNKLSLEQVKGGAPLPIYQVMQFIVEGGKNVMPFTDDVQRLTGQSVTFEEFVQANKSAFL